MKTVYSRNFARDLRKTRDKDLLARLTKFLKEIEHAETIGTIANLEKMAGYEHAYRVRIGRYRLGILWNDDTVVIARFLHRKDIYREFP